MTRFITAPMVNVNDDGATLSAWLKPDGTLVSKGEIIAVLETSKATIDLEAEEAGYLRIFAKPGSQVAVGDVLAALCETAEEIPQLPQAGETSREEAAPQRKVTRKAEIAAAKAGLDLAALQAQVAGSGPITEADVEALLARRGAAGPDLTGKDLVDDAYPQNRRQRLLIVGGGLGAVQLLDSLSRIEHQQATAIVDDNPSLCGKTVLNVPILGGRDAVERLFRDGVFDAAVVSVSTSIDFRLRMAEMQKRLNIPMANVIDPSARVQRNAVLGTGNVILAYCQIGSCAVLGDGNFLSPYVDIEHHCTVGDYCTFGPGVMMSSLVHIESRVKFGTGIFIEPKLTIGSDSIVGSGAILTRNIPANSIVKTKINYTLRSRAVSSSTPA
ncbi:MAG: biotin/lipoyl-containing protein [Acidobacteriaceae bacterium]